MNPTQSEHSPVSGMTLLEVLIAASSAGVVLAGLWGLLGTFAALYEKGLGRTQTQRLASALQWQLTEDLRNTIRLITQHSSSQTIDSTDDIRSPSSLSLVQPDDTGPRSSELDNEQPRVPDPFARRPVSLVGTRMSLVLDVLTPLEPSPDNSELVGSSREINENGNELTPGRKVQMILGADGLPAETHRRPVSRIPELRRVTYRFTSQTRMRGAFSHGLVRQQLDWEQTYRVDSGTGLEADVARSQIEEPIPSPLSTDGFSDPRAGASDVDLTNTSPIAAEQVVHADNNVDHIPEVIRFELRYFDGLNWHDSWDSRLHKALPVAVEVALDIDSTRDIQQFDSLNRSPASGLYAPLTKIDEPNVTSTRAGAVESSNAGSTYIEFDRSPTYGLTYWRPQYRFLIYLRPADFGDVSTETFGEDAP